MKYRLLNKTYAKLLGCFWLPCPICVQHFGGHEWGKSEFSVIINKDRESFDIGICPDCEEKSESSTIVNKGKRSK